MPETQKYVASYLQQWSREELKLSRESAIHSPIIQSG